MMKAHIKSGNGRVVVEVTAEKVTDLFEQVGLIQEVLAEDQCGNCGSPAIEFRARRTQKFKFYELACRMCNAEFSFGVRKEDHALYPKRRAENGDELAKGGWKVYRSGEHGA